MGSLLWARLPDGEIFAELAFGEATTSCKEKSGLQAAGVASPPLSLLFLKEHRTQKGSGLQGRGTDAEEAEEGDKEIRKGLVNSRSFCGACSLNVHTMSRAS